jgi:cyclopropane fatty-acyl-phospholipid synthase-like methyltransferase
MTATADAAAPPPASAVSVWDERYSIEEYLFGTSPNAFLKAHTALLKRGDRVLAVADGEGRNSVWLADNGLAVHAVDASRVGVAKARRLAQARGVSIEFEVADLAQWAWPVAHYDAVVAIFIQFAAPELRARLFEGMKQALKPGGLLLMEGYRPEQIAYATGGPPHAENMYEEEMLRAAFSGFEILELRAYDAEIQEGLGHRGMSALIDFVARKPA